MNHCSICGEKKIPGVVCCDELMHDLEEDD